jgi:hypothetical protein
VTTPLERPLAREIVLGDEAYKLWVSPGGLQLIRKGHRKGLEITWDRIIELGQAVDPAAGPADSVSDLPQAIAGDVAREVRSARDALARAGEVLARAGELPAAVLADVEPDPVYGRPRHASGWFIEPLLTAAEVASILRITRAAVSRLRLPSVTIEGERRYRQSELRRYLSVRESTG